MSYSDVLKFHEMLHSGEACMKGNRWKASVQGYELDILYNISVLIEQNEKGIYKPKPTYDFSLCERGKWRKIKAHSIIDRTLYKSWVVNDLVPQTKGRIMDTNCASQKGKGTDYAIKMFRRSLAKAYRKWGTDFYVVTTDYSNYFGSIPHDMIPIVIPLNGPESVQMLTTYVDVFPGDYGIGIGGEPSQVIAIVYPSSVDRTLACNCPTLATIRYMDDSFAICHTRDEARYTRDVFVERSEKLGLNVNMKRTGIHYMACDSITFLKKRTHLDPDTGKIVMQLTRKNIRERKACIDFQLEMIESGNMPRRAAFESIQCWCAYAKKYNSYEQMKIVVRKFSECFEVPDDIAKRLLHDKNKGWINLCKDANLF